MVRTLRFLFMFAALAILLIAPKAHAQQHWASVVAHSTSATHSMDLWSNADDSGIVGPWHYPGQIYAVLDNGRVFYGYAVSVGLSAASAQILYFDEDTTDAAWLTISNLGPPTYNLPGSGISRYPFRTRLQVLNRYSYVPLWDSGDCDQQSANRLFQQLFCWIQ